MNAYRVTVGIQLALRTWITKGTPYAPVEIHSDLYREGRAYSYMTPFAGIQIGMQSNAITLVDYQGYRRLTTPAVDLGFNMEGLL